MEIIGTLGLLKVMKLKDIIREVKPFIERLGETDFTLVVTL